MMHDALDLELFKCKKSKFKVLSFLFSGLQMASMWWGHFPLLEENVTEHADNSCFSAGQSTVLKGVRFGGVPIVLLLNFIFFVVSDVLLLV